MGLKKAIELNAIGMTIKADEALRIGLVNQVYPVDGFDACVDDYLGQIRKLSRPVVRMAKRATTLVAREQIMAHLERVEQLYLDELMKLSSTMKIASKCGLGQSVGNTFRSIVDNFKDRVNDVNKLLILDELIIGSTIEILEDRQENLRNCGIDVNIRKQIS